MPAPDAAEMTLTGEAGAASTKQAELHECVGAVPVVPFWALKDAPVLLSWIEFCPSVAPLVTYPSGCAPQPPAFVQYCLKTALLPPVLSPATVTFHPAPLPVESFTPKFPICALSVCDWPVRVSAGNAGASGTVVKASVPAVTENWVVSLDVAATAEDAPASRPTAAAAATAARVAFPCRMKRWSSVTLFVLRPPSVVAVGPAPNPAIGL